MRTSPAEGVKMPDIILKEVVLPAPFTPSKPKTMPWQVGEAWNPQTFQLNPTDP